MDLLDPGKKFMDEQNQLAKKLYNDMKKIEKDYKDAIYSMEKVYIIIIYQCKTKFHNTAKAAEIAKLDYELARLSYIPQNEKDKFNVKSSNCLKDAKEAERIYISSITYVNNVRLLFIDTSKNILVHFQLLEEEFIEFTKNTLRKFSIYTNSTSKNIQYDNDKVGMKVEAVDMPSDIQSFIESNKTNTVPPPKFEYIPYSIALRSKSIEEYNYPAEIIYNVIVELQSTFEKTNENEYVFIYL